ncbi:peptidylprolyl isomerase [Halomonas salinarum]|uniref:peptidylprolyl isomerase n=1 Tax=Halomonas salinarum TaxID=1158993 RepID=UPI001438D996|nr:peptidylprolyl isomerase [Halomonas salinarum]
MQKIDIEHLPGGREVPPVQVGEVVIDEETIAREMQYHPGESAAEAQRLAARALVVRELLGQRAQELGLPRLVDDQGVENDAAMTALLERELAVPEPDESACRRFFAAHPECFSTPTQRHVRHILLAAAPDDAPARDAQYQLGERLIGELRQAPERFTELAQRHSACPSRDEGGELGWLAPGQTVAELDHALEHLSEGLHERPLASRYGWHLVVVDACREGRVPSFEAVAERVRHRLHEQASRRALRHYLLALEEAYGVEGLTLDGGAEGPLMQ